MEKAVVELEVTQWKGTDFQTYQSPPSSVIGSAGSSDCVLQTDSEVRCRCAGADL